MEQGDSTFVAKESCPECGSRDNLARYSDGHGFCFGCMHYEPTTDAPARQRTSKMTTDTTFLTGTFRDLAKRRITQETCEKWGYAVGEMDGKPVQLANYRDATGRLCGQKVRFANKDFTIVGSLKPAGLYGQHLWREKGRMIVITEGEIDALTVSQVQGNKWPVVSLPNGAQSAKKAVGGSLDYLEGFDTVVLMFDDDEPGRDAVAACAPLFSPGKCKVARIPGFKDANEALQAGKPELIIDAIWGAKTYRPDGVISVEDVLEEVLKPIPQGIAWMFPEMTELTHGRRPGEIYGFGAGTGVGKTDLFTQQIAYDINVLGKTVGVIYLEQPPVETVRRIGGKLVGKKLHIPGECTQDDTRAAVEQLVSTGKLYLYDHFGQTDWATVKQRIRYMVVSLGCEHIFLDHLTALAAGEDDEKKTLDAIMSEMAGLAQELRFVLHFISHLATPEGKPHEEGGRVMIRHFRGSRAIGFWCHFMFGLERNQQAEDEDERSTTTFRCLKDRNTGAGTGKTIALGYDQRTGLLFVKTSACPFPQDDNSREAF